MKLHILSDLHLGFQGMEKPRAGDADVVVLAGDIARPKEAVAWALGFDKPVLYVPGNHEFYGFRMQDAARELQQLSSGTHVQVLDNRALVLGGVRFLGTTLWSDFRLFKEAGLQARAMDEAQRFMRDFSRIRTGSPLAEAVLAPSDTADLFAANVRWLEGELSRSHPGPTVVITHHAPSPRSIHPRFADSLLNACFVSDAEHLLDASRVRLWIHGHTHDSFDYLLNGTRVVCNPRGYAKDGVNENLRFDPELVIEVA